MLHPLKDKKMPFFTKVMLVFMYIDYNIPGQSDLHDPNPIQNNPTVKVSQFITQKQLSLLATSLPGTRKWQSQVPGYLDTSIAHGSQINSRDAALQKPVQPFQGVGLAGFLGLSPRTPKDNKNHTYMVKNGEVYEQTTKG